MKSERKQWVYYGIMSKPHCIGGVYVTPDLQFSGQFDKNGKEIYEGHIMKGLFGTGMGGSSTRYKEFHFKVIFYENRGFIIDMPKNYGNYRFLPYLSSCEIVSTIYENPELIVE